MCSNQLIMGQGNSSASSSRNISLDGISVTVNSEAYNKDEDKNQAIRMILYPGIYLYIDSRLSENMGLESPFVVCKKDNPLYRFYEMYSQTMNNLDKTYYSSAIKDSLENITPIHIHKSTGYIWTIYPSSVESPDDQEDPRSNNYSSINDNLNTSHRRSHGMDPDQPSMHKSDSVEEATIDIGQDYEEYQAMSVSVFVKFMLYNQINYENFNVIQDIHKHLNTSKNNTPFLDPKNGYVTSESERLVLQKLVEKYTNTDSSLNAYFTNMQALFARCYHIFSHLAQTPVDVPQTIIQTSEVRDVMNMFETLKTHQNFSINVEK
jgi:hypothetical protein